MESIRKAKTTDIPRLIDLLHQVNMVHHRLRPDLFKPHATKYDEHELAEIIADEKTPVFVYDEEGVQGYAFCQVQEIQNNRLLQDCRTLYIDDLCVDEQARGKHIGKGLFDFVRRYALSIGCRAITLNVWDGNDTALAFYRSADMHIQKTTMEMNL